MLEATNTSMHTLGEATDVNNLTQGLIMRKGEYVDIYVMSTNSSRAFIEDNRIERSEDYVSILDLLRKLDKPNEESLVMTREELSEIKEIVGKIAEKKERLRNQVNQLASKIENRRINS